MLGRLRDNLTDVPGYGHKLRNNSFNLDLQISDQDFVSLDESQLMQPRQANGDLPPITFLHLAEGSPLIDQGVDLGFPFHGARPDLGAFEK